MIRSIRRLSFVVLLMFLAILANITYVQYFQAADIRARAGNSRVIFEEYGRQRGPILLGSTAIASSIPTNDQLTYLRQYSNAPLYAPAPGYYSLVYGAPGIGRPANSLL